MPITRRRLGRTGIEVSELGLGTWPLAGEGPVGSYGAITSDEAASILDAYVSAGGNLIDTARVYNRSEQQIGEYLRRSGQRERLVLSSKTAAGRVADTVAEIEADLETSLRALGTDYLDVYFLHFPPAEAAVREEALAILLRLKERGTIRAIGASIYGPNVTAETQAMCSAYVATGQVDVLQVIYSVLRQQNLPAIEEAAAQDVGVIVRTALESGLLTGAYAPDHVFDEGDHRARYDREKLDYVLAANAELRGFAVGPPYASLAQVATRFSLGAPGVSSVIMGAQHPDEVAMNVETLALPPLSADVIEAIRTRYGAKTEFANFT